jgi:hypothetical protein
MSDGWSRRMSILGMCAAGVRQEERNGLMFVVLGPT